MSNAGKEHYIFYLQYTKEVTNTFFSLAVVLKNFGITLIPITTLELVNLARPKKQFVITATADLNSLNGLTKVRKSFLDFALINQKFCLFDISSFGKISISYKLEKGQSYFHFPLPMTFNQMGRQIASHYFSKVGVVKRWPGGNRARLPSMV